MSTADRKIDGHCGQKVCVLKSGGKASVNTDVRSTEKILRRGVSLFVDAEYVYLHYIASQFQSDLTTESQGSGIKFPVK